MKSLKMFVLALSVVLAACESDGAITGIPSSSTSTHHVSILELIPIDSPTFNTSIYFGKNPIDSTANTFGQYQTRYGFVPPIRLEDGETANLIASLEGAGGMQSDGVVKPIAEFLTDWQAVNSSAHKGVRYDGSSDIYFRALGFSKITASSQNIPVIYNVRHILKTGVAISDTLPAERDLWRAVLAAQRYKIGCAGNDSLVFRASIGLRQTITDLYNKGFVGSASPVQTVMLRCSVYTTAAEADAALARITTRARLEGM